MIVHQHRRSIPFGAAVFEVTDHFRFLLATLMVGGLAARKLVLSGVSLDTYPEAVREGVFEIGVSRHHAFNCGDYGRTRLSKS